ncbi:hypothetical protein BCE02nite_62080 [Brevibacillus centrosporus]|nr:hypothetical protein BCE02nite_62080 [Brevibacillus centrosporus]
MLGVDDGKVKVFDSLNVQEPGPLYCHFPGEDKGYTEEYFLGLTAEAPVYQTIGGRKYKTWKKIRDRNEPFDLAVYNRAVIEILRPNLSLPIERQPNGPKVTPGGTVVGKKRRKQGVSSSI